MRVRAQERRILVEVYCAYNRANGKCYVGQTRNGVAARFDNHCNGSKKYPFQRALIKYGSAAFVVGVIDIAFTLKSAGRKEQFWIKQLDCQVPHGYNLTKGGDGAVGLTPEILKQRNLKIGLANRKNKPTKAQRKHLSLILKELWKDPDYRTRMIAAFEGRKINKRPPATDETRRRMRESALKFASSRKGRILTKARIEIARQPQNIQKMRDSVIENWKIRDRIAHGLMMREVMAKPENRVKRSNRAKEVWATKSPAERSAAAKRAAQARWHKECSL